MATKRGTTKMSDTRAPASGSASATAKPGADGNQIVHLNRATVEAWLDTISDEERQHIADYASDDKQKTGSELT